MARLFLHIFLGFQPRTSTSIRICNILRGPTIPPNFRCQDREPCQLCIMVGPIGRNRTAFLRLAHPRPSTSKRTCSHPWEITLDTKVHFPRPQLAPRRSHPWPLIPNHKTISHHHTSSPTETPLIGPCEVSTRSSSPLHRPPCKHLVT